MSKPSFTDVFENLGGYRFMLYWILEEIYQAFNKK